MLKFECPSCGNGLFFNNFACVACGAKVGFCPTQFSFSLAGERQFCANRDHHNVCNWMSEPQQPFCRSCQTNQIVPDLGVDGNLEKWSDLEEGKRRLLFSCLRLGIPWSGLTFKFLAPTPEEPATTGHCDGVITVNIGEADLVTREANKQDLNEKFRTVIGHFRHEFGHFYWSQHVEPNWQNLDRFRALFGDERVDYQASLDQHYSRSGTRQRSVEHISVYATSHPWEDWAETFAHYLHMRDVLETAQGHGLAPLPSQAPTFDFGYGMQEWRRLSVAFNEVNRSMGLQDLYPFAISPVVEEKLAFIHGVIESHKASHF